MFAPVNATSNGGLGFDTIVRRGFVTNLNSLLQAGEDILDLTGMFAPGAVNAGNIGQFLHMNDTILQIDRDGGGNSFVNLVNIVGTDITNSKLDELYTAGQILA